VFTRPSRREACAGIDDHTDAATCTAGNSGFSSPFLFHNSAVIGTGTGTSTAAPSAPAANAMDSSRLCTRRSANPKCFEAVTASIGPWTCSMHQQKPQQP
jgi:hypothetical protein